MPYDTENVITSKKPYQVFAEIVHQEDGSYGSEVARRLDIKQQSASEIINKLNEVGLLEKGKRTKAQYYRLDTSGLVKLFLGIWERQVENNTKWQALEDLVELKNGFIQSQDLMSLLKLYVEHYTHNEDDSNIEKMLLDDFFEELESLIEHQEGKELSKIIEEATEAEIEIQGFPEVPEWLEDLYYIFKFSISSVDKHNLDFALQDYHNWKDS